MISLAKSEEHLANEVDSAGAYHTTYSIPSC
jgi:hypothetical protein